MRISPLVKGVLYALAGAAVIVGGIDLRGGQGEVSRKVEASGYQISQQLESISTQVEATARTQVEHGRLLDTISEEQRSLTQKQQALNGRVSELEGSERRREELEHARELFRRMLREELWAEDARKWRAEE